MSRPMPKEPSNAKKDLGPDIDHELASMQEKLKQIAALDWKEMREHYSFWNQVGSAITNAITKPTFFIPVVGPAGTITSELFSANDAKGAAERWVQHWQDEMFKAYDDVMHRWTEQLRPATSGSLRLAEVAAGWEREQEQALEAIGTRIRDLEQQDHWKGDSAEAYRQAIPSQRGAVDGLAGMIGNSSKLYDVASNAMTGVYADVLTANLQTNVYLVQLKPVQDSNDWGRRMRGAAAHLSTQLVGNLDAAIGHLESVGQQSLDKQHEIHRAATETKAFAKKHGEWPEAKGDTRDMAPHIDRAPDAGRPAQRPAPQTPRTMQV